MLLCLMVDLTEEEIIILAIAQDMAEDIKDAVGIDDPTTEGDIID